MTTRVRVRRTTTVTTADASLAPTLECDEHGALFVRLAPRLGNESFESKGTYTAADTAAAAVTAFPAALLCACVGNYVAVGPMLYFRPGEQGSGAGERRRDRPVLSRGGRWTGVHARAS